MTARTLRSLALLIIVFVIFCTGAAAQQKDFRLTTDQPQPILPSDIRIQSSATLGGLTLVVFGSSQLAADSSSVQNILLGQFVRDSALVGGLFQISSDSAHPSGYLQVLSLRDRFIVFWNDLRNGDSGIWEKVLDTNGILMQERYLGPGLVEGPGMYVVPIMDSYAATWNQENKPYSYSRYISKDGTLRPLAILDKHFTSVASDTTTNELFFVVNDLLQYSRNSLEQYVATDSLTALRFQIPYFLYPDGRLITYSKDTMRWYASTVAKNEFRKEYVKTSNIAWPHTTILADSSGYPAICYAGTFSRTILDGGIYFNCYRICVGSAHGGDLPHIVGQIDLIYSDFHSRFTALFLGASPFDYCAEKKAVTLHLEEDERLYGSEGFDSTGRSYLNLVLLVDRNGNFFSNRYPAVLDSASFCGFLVDTVVSRVPRQPDLLAVKSVGTLFLSLPVKTFPTSEYLPAIGLKNGKLYTALSYGRDSISCLELWNTDDHSRPLRGIANQLKPDGTYGLSSYSVMDSLVSMQGRLFRAVIDTTHISEAGNTSKYRIQYYLKTPTDTGWQETLVIDTVLVKYQRPITLSYVVDPNTTEISSAIATIDNTGQLRANAYRTDLNTENTRVIYGITQRLPQFTMAAIPIDTNEMIFMNDAIGIRWRDGVTVESIGGGSNPNPSRYLRYLGPYWGKVERGSMDRLNRYDYDGHLTGHQTIDPGHTSWPAIAQNSRDSSIAFIYATGKGVRLYRYDQIMRPLEANTLISSDTALTKNVSSAYRNDSLFVVWEDYRDTVPHIYATVVVRPLAGVGNDGEVVVSEDGMRLAPVPTGDELHISLAQGFSTPAILRIRDLYGALRLTQAIEPGATHIAVNTGELPNGVYMAALEGGVRTLARRLVIVR